ncbi:nucleotidyltransferase family protein [Acinetobacter sp. S40]|uniref:nucleotidyltransferase family protein n=1 Tax=Acinetobacter sp. S40 TaxID=2767434 RepID=UPI00190B9B23|nr:nucleotidyltransferase family protein [Acinetobacter sp. S40]MBJ9986712.1 nucleotidyltransferase family protein [Acinetobacter sp. S40]
MSKFNRISASYDHKIKSLILSQALLYQYLKALRTINEHCYVSAGVIRQLVWSTLHHQSYELEQMEIDVIFYNPEANQDQERQIQQELQRQFPLNEWDVVNQATVHHWYLDKNGQKIPAYTSLIEALSAWPETATAVAVRLNVHDQLEIVAPFGLHDLFELKLRWNPRLVSYETFWDRIIQKQWLQRWPKLELIDDQK